MCAMRSAKDLRQQVDKARNLSEFARGSSSQMANQGPGGVPMRTGRDFDNQNQYQNNMQGHNNYSNNGMMNSQQNMGGGGNAQNPEQARKMAMLAGADKDTIESQQKKLFNTRQELEKLRQEHAALKRNYESISHYAAQDSASSVGLKKQLAELDKQLKQYKVERLTFEEQLNKARAEADEMRAVNKENHTTIMEQKSEIKKLQEELKRSAKQYDHKIEMLNVSNKNMQEVVNKMKQEQYEFRQEIETHKATIAELERQLLLSQDSVKAIKELQSQLNEKEVDLYNSQQQIEVLTKDCLQKDLFTKEVCTELETVKERLEQSISREAELKISLNKLSKLSDEQTKRIKELEDKIKALGGSAGDANMEIVMLQREKDALEEQLKKLKDQLTEMNLANEMMIQKHEQERKDMLKQIEKYKADMQKAQQDLNASRKEFDQMTKELNNLRGKDTNMTAELERLRADRDHMKGQLDTLNTENKKMNSELEALQKKLDDQTSLSKQLAERADKLQSNLNREKVENDQLSAKIKALLTIFDKLFMNIKPIESVLSCLSCVTFIEEPPMTLKCGHSICKTCFNKHSDPNSKDSLVFCEECKLETKNKDMNPNSKFVTDLCKGVGGQRTLLAQAEKIIKK